MLLAWSLSTNAASWLTRDPWVEMTAIQNQSRGVTCPFVQTLLIFWGTIRYDLKKKKKQVMMNQTSVDEGNALLTGRGHGMNWAALTPPRSSRQRIGRIQSHLTHSAVTFDLRQHCPRVNCHLLGSMALGRRCLGPLGAMEGGGGGGHRMVDMRG